ncbi:MAG: helix-turn-helix transcriptional regulator [Dehalococcoidales bacterium]|nr:helix-turn-helix transcriptional regulator [Dehalococcoidales bacterium]
MAAYDKNMDIGKLLRQKRKSMSLTMREVSEKSEVSASHLSRIEQGDRFPSASVLRRLAAPLDYEETDLMMLAGYLSPVKQGVAAEGQGYRAGKIDPYVAKVLSQEPVEIQRTVITVLTLIKRIAASQKKS